MDSAIGGNHLMHCIRRNVDLKIILFNNRIYGLTKGQYSPTSEFGKKTKSTPMGSIDYPVNPMHLALSAEATFVARSLDIDTKHLTETLFRAAAHKGVAFVEVFQNCNIFNDGAFKSFADKEVRDDRMIHVQHGKPLVYGKNRDKGIRLNGLHPEVVQLGGTISESDLLVHDEQAEVPAPGFHALADVVARLPGPGRRLPRCHSPDPRRAHDRPDQGGRRSARQGDLKKLLESGETWTVS